MWAVGLLQSALLHGLFGAAVPAIQRSPWQPHQTHYPAESDPQVRHQQEMESISVLHLEVKDAFPELDPLSGVRNCVIEATLSKAKHLEATEGPLLETWMVSSIL